MTYITLSFIATLFALAGVPETNALLASPVFADSVRIHTVTSPHVGAGENLSSSVRTVPFYSQFDDITSPVWQRRGCGIASVAMIMEFHRPNAISVDQLLYEGLAMDGYIDNVGWIHRDLVRVAQPYGFSGASYDLSHVDGATAFAQFEGVLEDGPAIASVHYTFDPNNIIPHLVVITDVQEGMVYYNDPADPAGGGSISKEQFILGWKQRYIELQPV